MTKPVFGVGVRVKVRATLFGKDWAKEKFGSSWKTSFCSGVIKEAVGRSKFRVVFDIDKSEDDIGRNQMQLERDIAGFSNILSIHVFCPQNLLLHYR